MDEYIRIETAVAISSYAADEHPYNEPGHPETLCKYNEGWNDACDYIRNKLENAGIEFTRRETMKAIRFLPGTLPEPIEIENTLEALQKQVGGHIESLTLGPDLCAVCNEEGRLLNLPYCGEINYVPFYGPVILVGVHGESFCDVPVLKVDKTIYRIRSKEESNEAHPF